jgi:hypothetical protein
MLQPALRKLNSLMLLSLGYKVILLLIAFWAKICDRKGNWLYMCGYISQHESVVKLNIMSQLTLGLEGNVRRENGMANSKDP